MRKHNRDEFPQRVREAVAKRVAYRCSRPGCGRLTSGPHSDPGKSLQLGAAAHIIAATAGGPRADPESTSEQRSSIDNAIWLCRNCATLIDEDETKYPVEELRRWKSAAEMAARVELEWPSADPQDVLQSPQAFPPHKDIADRALSPNNKPWYQKAFINWSVVLTAFVALGEIVDVIGAAISLISPRLTYYGTAGILVTLAAAQLVARWKRPKFVLGSTSVAVTRLGRHAFLNAFGCIALLWIPRLFDRTPSSTPAELEFPAYDSGLRDLKGAYFANGPVRMIDAIVLDDSQFGRYDNYNTGRDRILTVRDGASILVSIFFYNSALDPAATDTTVVGSARVTAQVHTTMRTVHPISAGIVGVNTKAIYSTSTDRGGNISIRSSTPIKLRYVPGSTFVCVHRPPIFERQLPTPSDPTGVCQAARPRGPVQLVHLPDGIVNGATPLGYIPGQLSGFVVFRLNVSAR